jgi:nucleotide-binding universal stress UspA family protein
MADTEVHVLICYDGSEHAKHAIDGASRLFPGAPATVLYVTESLAHMLQRYPSPDSFVGDIPFETVDANNAEVGSSIADEGAALAIKAGMKAKGRCVTSDGSAWNAALIAADELDAAVIVAGDRGRSGVRELVRGGFSRHLLQHSNRPVLALPDPELAHARRKAAQPSG